jgi:hypothetical protein
MSEALNNFLKRCGDVLATLALLYPPFILLLSAYQNKQGPMSLGDDVAGWAMFVALPAVIWFWWREMSDPPGSHPIVGKILTDDKFGVRIVVASGVIFFILHTAIQLLRSYPLIEEMRHG